MILNFYEMRTRAEENFWTDCWIKFSKSMSKKSRNVWLENSTKYQIEKFEEWMLSKGYQMFVDNDNNLCLEMSNEDYTFMVLAHGD